MTYVFISGLGKLASIMANKGKGLMSEESWNEIHADEVPDKDMAFGGKN